MSDLLGGSNENLCWKGWKKRGRGQAKARPAVDVGGLLIKSIPGTASWKLDVEEEVDTQ